MSVLGMGLEPTRTYSVMHTSAKPYLMHTVSTSRLGDASTIPPTEHPKYT